MKGSSHLAIGLAAGALIINHYHQPLDAGMFILAAAVIGSVLPDIDHPRSLISNNARPLRLPFILFAHRGFTHSLVAFFLLNFALYLLKVPVLIALSFLVAYSLHIAADMLTVRGVRFFYPLRARIRFPQTVAVRGMGEHFIATSAYLLALGMLAQYVAALK